MVSIPCLLIAFSLGCSNLHEQTLHFHLLQVPIHFDINLDTYDVEAEGALFAVMMPKTLTTMTLATHTILAQFCPWNSKDDCVFSSFY